MPDLNKSSREAEILQAKLEDRTAVCGVVGLGYVGLPLVGALHDASFKVLGFDVDPSKIGHLEAGTSYLSHLGEALPQRLAQSSAFEPTAEFSRLEECDVIIVCVPTPVGKHREPDLSYVVATGEAIGRTLRPGQLIVLESTTYPTTTREVFLPAIKATSTGALSLGEDIFVAFSPEREDPGRASHNTKTIPKLVGGLDDSSTHLAVTLYSTAVEEVVAVKSAEIAEAAKILENVFRAVNIAMVNELKVLFEQMGIDTWEVIEAAATKPFGFMPFSPGPGLGGHCIPIDPFYLTWKAREFGLPTRFIELAGEINHRMPQYVVERSVQALNQQSKPVLGSRILIVGMAYKPNVDDTRETPSVEIVQQLAALGGVVEYHDPHVATVSNLRKHPGIRMYSVPLTEEYLNETDLVVVATDHDAVDWSLIGRAASLVVDTRNVMARLAESVTAVVIKA
jgi:UDP-N-acetyl-D-glucosamine dehydrogenase